MPTQMVNDSNQPMVDVVELTVADIEAGFASGRFSSEQLTVAFQQRIERYNPAYNAIIFHNPAALEDARAIDRAVPRDDAAAFGCPLGVGGIVRPSVAPGQSHCPRRPGSPRREALFAMTKLGR